MRRLSPRLAGCLTAGYILLVSALLYALEKIPLPADQNPLTYRVGSFLMLFPLLSVWAGATAGCRAGLFWPLSLLPAVAAGIYTLLVCPSPIWRYFGLDDLAPSFAYAAVALISMGISHAVHRSFEDKDGCPGARPAGRMLAWYVVFYPAAELLAVPQAGRFWAELLWVLCCPLTSVLLGWAAGKDVIRRWASCFLPLLLFYLTGSVPPGFSWHEPVIPMVWFIEPNQSHMAVLCFFLCGGVMLLRALLGAVLPRFRRPL